MSALVQTRNAAEGIDGTQSTALAEIVESKGCEIVNGILCRSQARPTIPFYEDEAYRRFVAALPQMHSAHYKPGSFSGWLEETLKRDLLRLVTTAEPPIFDLGCGTGSGFDLLGGADKVVGVDGNMGLLQQAKQHHPSATLVCAELHDLPIMSRSVRTIFAIASLEHVFDLEASLAEIARCLHPDGKFYVLVPTEGGLAVEVARLVTSRRNARIIGITRAECDRAQRKDHCNTVYAVENALRKFFTIDAVAAWPFRIGGAALNLVKSYRLARL